MLWGSLSSSRTAAAPPERRRRPASPKDRKSTRLNSSHLGISYAVFCLKKKKKRNTVKAVVPFTQVLARFLSIKVQLYVVVSTERQITGFISRQFGRAIMATLATQVVMW